MSYARFYLRNDRDYLQGFHLNYHDDHYPLLRVEEQPDYYVWAWLDQDFNTAPSNQETPALHAVGVYETRAIPVRIQLNNVSWGYSVVQVTAIHESELRPVGSAVFVSYQSSFGARCAILFVSIGGLSGQASLAVTFALVGMLPTTGVVLLFLGFRKARKSVEAVI